MSSELMVIEQNVEPIMPTIQSVLPAGTAATAERIYRGVRLAAERNDYLVRIAMQNPQSLVNSVLTAANLGLEVDGVTGQGFIVPFGGNQAGIVFMPGYKGYITLADNGGFRLIGDVVYEADTFEYDQTDPQRPVVHKFDHRLKPEERGRLVGSWAVATAPGKHAYSVYVPLESILAARNASASWKFKPNTSPWKTNFEAMAAKTAKRRLGAQMPLRVTQMAAAMEHHLEEGRPAYVTDGGVMVQEDDRSLSIDTRPAEPEQSRPVGSDGSLDRPAFRRALANGEVKEYDDPNIWAGQMQRAIDAVPFDMLADFESVNRAHIDAAREAGAESQVRAVERALADRKGGA